VSDLPPPPATASTVPMTVDDADVDIGVFLERDDDGDDVDAAWRRSLFTSVMLIAYHAAHTVNILDMTAEAAADPNLYRQSGDLVINPVYRLPLLSARPAVTFRA